MIYTVGLTHLYEPQLAAGPVVKQGARTGPGGEPYPGGWVWRMPQEARAFLVARGSEAVRSVYGVEADWEADTSPAPGETYRYLVHDAQVVRIPRSEGGTAP